MNVVTKSGSNHWHGTSFYFLRDSILNVQHADLDTKPDVRQQQFGFTFGGPIKRNKAFFFIKQSNIVDLKPARGHDGRFVQYDKAIGIKHFPAHFTSPSHMIQAANAYAPRQVQ